MRVDARRYIRYGSTFGLPEEPQTIKEWVDQLMQRARKKSSCSLDPTVLEFRMVVEDDAVLKPLAASMFTELPDLERYKHDPTGTRPEIESFDDLVIALNEILTSAPEWTDAANKVGLIGFPINAVLDWPMATAAGSVFFLCYPQVNECLKKILSRWGQYLQSLESTKVLRPPNGWLGTDGLQALTVKGNQNGLGTASEYTFSELYKCPDPSNPDTFGFKSWDEFFVRQFNNGIRSADCKSDPDIIVHACESAPFQYPVTNVKITDHFMGKNQAYSLSHMLDDDPLATQFVGGTVYQAFLSALSYHRWHSPVDGKIIKTTTVPGTYYAESIYQGFLRGASETRHPDIAAPKNSQPFIASVATRGLVFIEAENPEIGLMCFIGIGMAEVSCCEFFVREGQQVSKGDQLGSFHFGGSTYCLVFRPETKLDWIGLPPAGSDKYADLPNFRVNSALAQIRGSSRTGTCVCQ